MALDILTVAEFTKILAAGGDTVDLPPSPIFVDLDRAGDVDLTEPLRAAMTTFARPVVGLVRQPAGLHTRELAELVDLLVADPDVDIADLDAVQPPDGLDDAVKALGAEIAAHPLAATALALLLRSSRGSDVGRGLVAESAVYSMLQAGPEFARWLAARRPPPSSAAEHGPSVLVERDERTLRLTLARPAKHNAFSARMRDELLDALSIATVDPSIARVELAGDGPSFCSGGDLDEFGTRPDPATAHLVRLTRSAARLVDRLRARVEVELHGWCIGAGIELPSFAGTVTAAPATRIVLPEVRFGLVPGAGGTVSLPRRIGRQRTAWLGLTGATLDARTALDWGLVDAIVDAPV
jgi:enoyl-CoA hydratase/carnithine racemase